MDAVDTGARSPEGSAGQSRRQALTRPAAADEAKEDGTMTIELSAAERGLLRKVLDSYLSELRQAIAATKRDTSPLHDEENLIKALQQKLS
jgi:hypothetical protein